MYWVETIVCSPKDGCKARLLRMLKARQELKRRDQGCAGAWVGAAPGSSPMYLVQSVYKSRDDWQRVSSMIVETIDEQDGGVEPQLLGPPLVGIFEIEESEVVLS